MARWTASAKWAAGPALDGQRDMPLALRLSEGLGLSARMFDATLLMIQLTEDRSALGICGLGPLTLASSGP